MHMLVANWLSDAYSDAFSDAKFNAIESQPWVPRWVLVAPRWVGTIMCSYPPMFRTQLKEGWWVVVSHPRTDQPQHCLTSVIKTF